jgi:hypothetical protein
MKQEHGCMLEAKQCCETDMKQEIKQMVKHPVKHVEEK